jgi:putative ABC transport system substrate-binding protein
MPLKKSRQRLRAVTEIQNNLSAGSNIALPIAALVAQCRLPAIYPLRYFCEAGSLMSYGVNIDEIIAGAASFVDLILRGAKPAELPVQGPTELELVVNQKTARQLGLQLPSALLARADEVSQ